MSSAPLQQFQRRLDKIEHTRARLEHAFSSDRLRLSDVEVVYESLFVRATIGFENYLEELFCHIMRSRLNYGNRRVAPIVPMPSTKTLYRVLWADEKYLDWMPYERTVKRAQVWLRSGQPFAVLGDGHRSRLKVIHTIRNVIAHSSDHVTNEFRRIVIGQQHLRPRDKTPAGYLRSIYITAPRTTRFQQFMGDLHDIAVELSPS